MATFQKKSGAHLSGPRHLPSTLKAPPSSHSCVRSASICRLPCTLQGPTGLPVVSSSTAAPSGPPMLPQGLPPCLSYPIPAETSLTLLLSLAPADVLCSLPLQLPDRTLAGCSVTAGPLGLSRELRGWTLDLYTAQDRATLSSPPALLTRNEVWGLGEGVLGDGHNRGCPVA